MITIVSGCPRSGTSLTMNILEKAGLNIAKDDLRTPDSNNPKGYFEIDDIINKLKENPDYIKQFEGKVVKVINYGLKYLPKGDYKLIYMQRNFKEIADSMKAMSGEEGNDSVAFKKLDEEVKQMLEERDDFEGLLLNYADYFKNPKNVEEIINFLDIPENTKEGMLSVIDRTLYRNKSYDESEDEDIDKDYIEERLKSLGYL